MFGWGKRKREIQIVEDVCERIRPQLMILERQLGDYPRALADDPFVIGYIVAASTIFCHIETNGKASREMIGLASLAALRVMFAPLAADNYLERRIAASELLLVLTCCLT